MPRYPCPVTPPSRVPDRFRAFVAEKVDDRVERGVRTFDAADLPAGEVEVRVGLVERQLQGRAGDDRRPARSPGSAR